MIQTTSATTEHNKNLPDTISAAFHPVSVAWKPFCKKLIAVLKDLQEDQWLILQKKNSNEWIQFISEGSFGLRLETKSNAYREDDQQLSEEQVARLLEIGWHSPTNSPEASTPTRDPDGSPNHYSDFRLPLKAKAITALTIRTFTEVLAVSHPGMLQYEAFSRDGTSLLIPELGLIPVICSNDASENPKLSEQLLGAITELTGVGGWSFDDQGDIGPIGYGSIKAFARIVEESPYVRFYVPAVEDVEETPQLLSKLNTLNCVHGHMHMCLMNNCIMAVSDVLVSPFSINYVAAALGNFLQVADEFAIELVAEFGDASSLETPLH